MAKNKLKSTEDMEAQTVKNNLSFVPVHKKYKPLPKFNGKCKNC